MVVRAGETVKAWRRDGMTSIETSGVAEQSGVAGARIQVRLLRRDLDGQDAERHVSGVVDGVGSVELQ
jgi:flagella basal body P-ring formation protein FlgA